MAIFNSTKWTGRDDSGTTVVAEAPTRMESAPKKLKPRVESNLMNETAIAEYRKVAAEVGISDQDMLVEEFRVFLAKHDLPTFNLQEVVSYMDDIAAKDNPTGLGWHWCPVRAKDAEAVMTFGRPSVHDYRRESKVTASDFYQSHPFNSWRSNNMPVPEDWRQHRSPAYSRTLPLHALKKIAFIEKNFTAGKPIFLVTDYTVAPHIIINPDPFLMAVIPNSAVAHGKGRFIIDVWDEPGFGIDRMVK